MFTVLLSIIGVIVIAKWILGILFPVTAFRIRAALMLRTLVRALEKEARRQQ